MESFVQWLQDKLVGLRDSAKYRTRKHAHQYGFKEGADKRADNKTLRQELLHRYRYLHYRDKVSSTPNMNDPKIL